MSANGWKADIAKLGLDFRRNSRRHAAMDDARDLIDRLCTIAGMIMEDVSAMAVVIDEAILRGEKIRIIRTASQDIDVLAEAASVISRRGES